MYISAGALAAARWGHALGWRALARIKTCPFLPWRTFS
jgi:hypothetical protein